jgi:hypothetical protein
MHRLSPVNILKNGDNTPSPQTSAIGGGLLLIPNTGNIVLFNIKKNNHWHI